MKPITFTCAALVLIGAVGCGAAAVPLGVAELVQREPLGGLLLMPGMIGGFADELGTHTTRIGGTRERNGATVASQASLATTTILTGLYAARALRIGR